MNNSAKVSVVVPLTAFDTKPVVIPSDAQISTTSSIASGIIQEVFVPERIPQGNPDSKFGFSVGVTLYSLSDKKLSDQLNDMVSLGVEWVRVDFSWSIVQPQNSSQYNWSQIDRVVKAVNARNMKVLPVLSYTPKWARNALCIETEKCSPASAPKFAEFAGRAASRYSSQGVHVWEIWNEPNLKGFWKPEVSPLAYLSLLKPAYVAIKKVDSTAIVITGGVGPAETKNGNISPIDFIEQIYALDGKLYFDAIGHHPYSFPATPSIPMPWSGWSQMSETLRNIRSLMVLNGDDHKQIWMTEVGAPTGGPGVMATPTDINFDGSPDHVSEGLQAKILTEALVLHKEFDWAGPLFWYSYKDLGTSKSTVENFFGIIRYDGSKKPAYEILKI